jgi:hypothetical protein
MPGAAPAVFAAGAGLLYTQAKNPVTVNMWCLASNLEKNVVHVLRVSGVKRPTPLRQSGDRRVRRLDGP